MDFGAENFFLKKMKKAFQNAIANSSNKIEQTQKLS